MVRGKPGPATKGKGAGRRAGGDAAPRKARRRPRGPVSVRDEILRHGGTRGDRRFQAMAEASEAYDEGRERDAVRILRPLVKAMPGAPSVRELLGLSLYRSGQYPAAAEQLEAYVAITGEVDQHPVLMDCARARRDHDRVDELWRELAEVSPGRGARDRGSHRARGLARGPRPAARRRSRCSRAGPTPRPSACRSTTSASGTRSPTSRSAAGNLPRARTLFDRVRRHDASFADVAERLAALG